MLFRFEPIIKHLITQLKYHHRAAYAPFLAERLALALNSHERLSSKLHDPHTIISYVPSHRIRHYITKGYNQSQLLARFLCQALGKEKEQQVCRKIRATRSQVKLSRNERTKNIADAFRVCTDIPAGSTIILVDDVLTSGSTLMELARIIKKTQPNCQIWGLCLARNA